MPETSTEKVEQVFFSALEIQSPAERKIFLDRACEGDAPLRSVMDKMLASLPDAKNFFPEGGVVRLPMNELSQSLAELPNPGETAGMPAGKDAFVGKDIGPYKLLQKIGEGGCGVVYMAEQDKPVRRRVALKIIKLGMDTNSVIARFEAERQALALMDHPNIARVLDAGATESGRPYFVMELVRGVKITEYCDQNELATPQRLKLFIQVCHAIQHAHQKGVIHRDIKPSNILVTIVDGLPVPKVIDFGIAKAIEGRLTDSTIFTPYEQFIGTPAYMSPEQAVMSAVDVDTRSDIYSLGVLLYELLTGRTPFESKTLLEGGIDELRRTLQEEEPQRPSVMVTTMQGAVLSQLAHLRQVDPSKLISQLRGDLDWIVICALEKDRARRYQTANGLALDVQRYLNSEPVAARPPSRRYRLQKLVHRNKATFAAIAAVSVALIAGFSTSTWLFFKEREARQEQARLREEAERARRGEAQLRSEADARAIIAQAALLMSRNQTTEADQLMSKIEIPVIQPSLEAAGVFRRLGEWNVMQGRWPMAADQFLKLVQANQVDKTDKSEQATWDLLRAGPTLIAAGAMEQYRQFIQETLDHFAGTADPVAAEQIIKVSLLVPTDATTLQRLKPFAKIVEESMAGKVPTESVDVYRFAWWAFSLSLLDYRRGDYTDAVIWGQRCLNSSDQAQSRIAMAHVILAMSYAKLEQTDKARSELAVSREAIRNKLPHGLKKILDLGKPYPGLWHDWVVASILLGEAENLIK